MDRPTQAVILAGGKGTRLLPLTRHLPKPMLAFHGRPFLAYLIEQLKEQGFKRILLLLGYLPDKIMDYFGDGRRFGIRIEYDITDEDNLTGRRLFLAQRRIDPLFFLLYCDNYLPFSFERMWHRFQELDQPAAMVTAYANPDKSSRRNLRMEPDHRITLYDSQRQAENLHGIDIAYMITDRRVLDLIPDENVSFEKTVYPHLAATGRFYAWPVNHGYYSVGNLDRLPLTGSFLRRQPAIILFLDAMLHRSMPHDEQQANQSETWRWQARASEALALLIQAGCRIILFCHQGGLVSGAVQPGKMDRVPQDIQQLFDEAGGSAEAVYACCHSAQQAGQPLHDLQALLFTAQKAHHLDLSRVPMLTGDPEINRLLAMMEELPLRRIIVAQDGLMTAVSALIDEGDLLAGC